jgi:hypothetical protein
VEPNAYGSISFARITSSGDKDQQLNIIQVKKINPLFSWYHRVPYPMVSHWFDLDDTAFQVWRACLASTPNPGALLLSPVGSLSPSSAIYDFCKSVKRSISDCNAFKEDPLWNSWHQRLLTTARSHNVDKVLNLSYSPTTPDDGGFSKKSNVLF